MRTRKRKNFSPFTSLIIIGGISILLFYLREPDLELPETTITLETTSESVESESVEQKEEVATLPPIPTVPVRVDNQDINELTHNLSKRQIDMLFQEIQSHDRNFTDNLLQAQPDILEAIKAIRANPEELGYLFLPNHPAQLDTLQQVHQLDVPLKLQKDPQWRSTKYGDDTTRELGENGCAIVSLAMVHDYYSAQTIEPKDILDWSQEHFYLHNQGTSWDIFHHFAQEFGYTFYNHGDNFYSAMEALTRGEVVVASVRPGTFTDVGHILVIRGYDNKKVYVNDPNDDPAKMFSIQGIDENVFLEEGVNYWSFGQLH